MPTSGGWTEIPVCARRLAVGTAESHHPHAALNKVGCAALVTATAFKSSDYMGMLETLAPELAASDPGRLSCARLPNRTASHLRHP
ncbi:hypothetical protein [Paracoccus mutanolyticus]|nr:hypothetical protein [Paracoccus mutanolyticus]